MIRYVDEDDTDANGTEHGTIVLFLLELEIRRLVNIMNNDDILNNKNNNNYDFGVFTRCRVVLIWFAFNLPRVLILFRERVSETKPDEKCRLENSTQFLPICIYSSYEECRM